MTRLVYYNGRIGVVSSDCRNHLRFTDRHFVVYIVPKAETEVVSLQVEGGATGLFYRLFENAKPVVDYNHLPEDLIAFEEIQTLSGHP